MAGGRHCDTGEGNDAASLDLPGAQEELARVVLAANPRTIVTHTDGRPLTSPHIYANCRRHSGSIHPRHLGRH